MKVLVLGATGMLGHAAYRVLSERAGDEVWGAVRDLDARRFFAPELASRLVSEGDLEDAGNMARLLARVAPDVVVNGLSLTRPFPSDPMKLMSMFAFVPRQLAHLCRLHGARLVHVSSDAVFSGSRGNYGEDDLPDPADAYGTAKLLGEPAEAHTITLRTSMIGHELKGRAGLLEWFLAQRESCRCHNRAIFSGLPTVALSQLIRDVILPRPDLSGVYHVAARPISKFDLLQLVADAYGRSIEMVPDAAVKIDRSLDAERLRRATGYVAPQWPALINLMHAYR